MFPRWVFHYFPPPPNNLASIRSASYWTHATVISTATPEGAATLVNMFPIQEKKNWKWCDLDTCGKPQITRQRFLNFCTLPIDRRRLSGLGQLPIVGVREHVALRWAESCSRFKGDNGDGLLTDGCCGEKSGSQRQTLSYVRFFFL